jgi:hypothetical protein
LLPKQQRPANQELWETRLAGNTPAVAAAKAKASVGDSQ